MIGEEAPKYIPPPMLPALLPVMMQLVMIGEEAPQRTPPPLLPLFPFVIVNPSRTEPEPSPLIKVTTVPPALPSMIVLAAPFIDLTVMALPMKLICST